MLIVFKNNFPQTGYFLLDFLRKDCKSSSLLVKYRIKLKKILTEMEFSKRLTKCFISQVRYYEGQFLSCIFPEGKKKRVKIYLTDTFSVCYKARIPQWQGNCYKYFFLKVSHEFYGKYTHSRKRSNLSSAAPMFCYIIQVTNFFDNSWTQCQGVAVNSKTMVWSSLSTKIADTKDEPLRINKIIRNVNFHPAIYYPNTSSVSVWFVHISISCAGSSANGFIQERIGIKKLVSLKFCSYKPWVMW